ncbi:MAG: TVP38/TMEM64 family protein [Gammaproteobacteria bacterium]|nr:TVP38/TMEM64 family protein [Gammaproteobacteria bacterium]
MSYFLEQFKKKKGIRRFIGPKRIAFLLLFSFLGFWGWNSYTTGELSPDILSTLIQQYPFASVLLFICAYVACVIFLIPTLPLNLAAGFFWGGILGGLYTSLGVTLGGWLAFLVARWVIGQPLAQSFDNGLAGKVQASFDKNGWKFVAFARINPIFPTGPLNYLLGLTSLQSVTFLWTTFVFLIPPSVAVAYIGDVLQTFSAQDEGVEAIIRKVLIASAAITIFVIFKYIGSILSKKDKK